MDAQDNKRLLMEAYQMFKNGEIPQLLERFHDDALWIEPEGEHVPFGGRYQGKAEIARFFATLDATAQPLHFVPREFIAEGDKVVVSGDATWLARNTGRSFDSPWVHVFTLRDGKVTRFTGYSDTAAGEKAFRPDQPGQAPGAAAPLHH